MYINRSGAKVPFQQENSQNVSLNLYVHLAIRGLRPWYRREGMHPEHRTGAAGELYIADFGGAGIGAHARMGWKTP